MHLLGYADGYVYHSSESGLDVYKGDYADPHDEDHAPCGARWLCTRPAWPLYLRGYDIALCDAGGAAVGADGWPA